MGAVATMLIMLLGGYVVAGVMTALVFIMFGVTRVQPQPVTLGARILILPGAIALWPVVLTRWIRTP